MSEENIRKDVLGNGLTILTERIEHLRSVSLGIWLKKGSRDESPSDAGVYHFIEHMLFKGTKKRSTYEIAQIMDSIGGFNDAFTSKENTCFYAKVLDEHLPIILDIFQTSSFIQLFTMMILSVSAKLFMKNLKWLKILPAI